MRAIESNMFDAAPLDGTAWSEVPAGPELAHLLAEHDPAGLSGYALVDYLKASERQASWTASLQLRAVAELAGRKSAPDGDGTGGVAGRLPTGQINEFVDVEIAAALHLSRSAAAAKLGLALRLHELTAVSTALRQGVIDLPRARVFADGLIGLDDETATVLSERLLVRAARQTASQLRSCLQRAVLAVNPAAAEEAHQQAIDERRVVLTPVANGMTEFWALLPADAGAALYGAVTALADQAKTRDDHRSIDQRRADVLGDLGYSVLDNHELPPRHRRRPHLLVTVAATTLLGLDEEPGELAGYGPIPASMARRLAEDGTWRRILTDPVSGTLLDTAPPPTHRLSPLSITS